MDALTAARRKRASLLAQGIDTMVDRDDAAEFLGEYTGFDMLTVWRWMAGGSLPRNVRLSFESVVRAHPELVDSIPLDMSALCEFLFDDDREVGAA